MAYTARLTKTKVTFEEMKAEYEQSINDVNPVTPPKKKAKTVEHVDLCTPSSSSTCTELSTS